MFTSTPAHSTTGRHAAPVAPDAPAYGRTYRPTPAHRSGPSTASMPAPYAPRSAISHVNGMHQQEATSTPMQGVPYGMPL